MQCIHLTYALLVKLQVHHLAKKENYNQIISTCFGLHNNKVRQIAEISHAEL